MPDLPKKKVGIVACSGEELSKGTVSRLAALQVLEELRPAETVTICLPLFLAGGEGDRAFARFYPTVAVDGCEERCAARATEIYSGKPAASVVVSEICTDQNLGHLTGRRRLNEAGNLAVAATAQQITSLVDELLEVHWSRREGAIIQENFIEDKPGETEAEISACACGSGIPVQNVKIDGISISLIALPILFEQFWEAGKKPEPDVASELIQTLKIYNPIPAQSEEAYRTAIFREYKQYWTQQEVKL